MITSILTQELSYAIAWTLIHTIWQISLIALILSLVLKFNKSASSERRYTLSFVALFATIISTAFTFCLYYVDAQNAETATASIVYFQNVIADPINMSSPLLITNFIEEYRVAIVNAWVIGSILFFIKFIGGFVYLKNIINKSQAIDQLVGKTFKKLNYKFGINRNISIRSSHMINTPMVMGYIKPVILFPVGLINQLSTKEVEAILAHELAHIKRHDYLLNIIQIFTEILFYFHPAIWYISAQIRTERENCCDDLAIKHTGSSINYAKTLVKLQELELSGHEIALAFSGNRNSFKNRIMRILNHPTSSSQYKDKVLVALLLFFSLFLGANNYSEDNSTNKLDNFDVYVIDDCPQSPEDIKYYLDTIPERNTFHIKKKTNDEEMLELEMENGEITKLKIGGETVPEEEYDKHVDIIEELRPGADRDIITLFPECGNDFGKVYLLDRLSRKTTNMDSVLAKLKSKSEFFEQLAENNNFNFRFDDFDNFWIDSLKTEVIELGDNDIFIQKDVLIDSIWDLFPQNLNGLFVNPSETEESIAIFPGGKIHLKKYDNPSEGDDVILKWLDRDALNGRRVEIFRDIEEDLDRDIVLRMLDKDALSGRRVEILRDLEREVERAQENIFEDLSGEFEILRSFPGENQLYFFDEDNDFERLLPRRIERDNNFVFPGLGSQKVSDVITQSLLKDGLIESDGKTKIELTHKHLKINGDKQPKNIYNKYKKIYEKHTGLTLEGKAKIKFEISPEEKKRTGLFFSI